jgi:hypothetical protein
MQAVVAGNAVAFSRMLARSPSLATAVLDVGASRDLAAPYFFDVISHYVNAGDTPLHVAAAAYRNAIARSLLAAGANVQHGRHDRSSRAQRAADASEAASVILTGTGENSKPEQHESLV